MTHSRVVLARTLALAALVTALLPAADAAAGGFYLLPRGTRALGRGGAYVAGVEDPHALWYNPAGLAYSGDQLLLDATLTLFEAQFTRIDSGGNTQPTVTGYHPYVPIPTLGGSFSIDELPEWTFGLSVQAPNAALNEWPTGPDAPQRYSVLSLEGSLLATVAAGAAWRPIPELSIGLGMHLLVGSFNAQVALSACDGTICTFPEDPEYDAVANIALPSVFPIFTLGTVIDLDVVRIGISVMTPFNLEGAATIDVRPPSAAAFEGAEVVNRREGCNHEDPDAACRSDTIAQAQIEFPLVLRLGVEVRPIDELRIELAGVYETWSFQDSARIDPQDVWIEGALNGGLEYQVGPINIPRNMNDTVSVRLGGAYTIEQIVTVRAGVSYENSSFSDAYLTPLTLDSDKVISSIGVTIDPIPELSIDILGGYAWFASRQVRNSAVPQSNPIRPPRSESQDVFIGNGDYSMAAPFFGLALRGRLDGGHIRGPGTEDDEASEEEPNEADEDASPAEQSEAAEETEATEQTAQPEDEGEAAPEGDESTPWYLRGQGE